VKSRLLLAVAFVATILATVVVTVNVMEYRHEPGDSVDVVTVVVATEDIPPGARLRPLIKRGAFEEVQIPRSAVIDTAVTDIDALHGNDYTTSVILEIEQVWSSRLGGYI
jgi:hypothetical protein